MIYIGHLIDVEGIISKLEAMYGNVASCDLPMQ